MQQPSPPSNHVLLFMVQLIRFQFIRSKKALVLNDYQEWFNNFVGDWIDVAASKCNVEIKRAVTALDKVRNFCSCVTCFTVLYILWKLLFQPSRCFHLCFIHRLSLSLRTSSSLNLLWVLLLALKGYCACLWCTCMCGSQEAMTLLMHSERSMIFLSA